MTEAQVRQYAADAAAYALKTLERQPSVRLLLTEQPASVTESKIGGLPYFPAGAEIPTDGQGNQLRFLMQIKCSDVHGIDGFPKAGMIQFWITADEIFGMTDDGFRVIYYDSISEAVTEPPVTPFNDMEKEYFPLKGEFGIQFAEEQTPKNAGEYSELFCKYFNEVSGEQIQSIYDIHFELKCSYDIVRAVLTAECSNSGHNIGGTSDFCQFDPRETDEQRQRWDFQLLQLSSDFGRVNGQNFTRIMWGDAGICHFFINREKLKNCDFSDIMYYCDCC